ncbi:putative ribonuclease H-like domain-containing protein [Tanacetum coccineum]
MNMDGGSWGTAVKPSAGCSWRIKRPNVQCGSKNNGGSQSLIRSMTGNKEKLADFVKIKGGTVTFGGGDGQITRKGTIRTSTFNFENVYYVEELQNFNLVLVTRPHNKTPYELLSGKVPNISHLKPFGCHVTILNTSDHLGKFEGKADEGFLVGYSAHSKAYRVYNLSNKKIEETLNLRYMEDKPNVQGLGHEWYFDLDYLTDSLGYTRFKSNQPAGTQDTNNLMQFWTWGTLKKFKFGESALQAIVAQALNDADWVEAMQEEMQQFVNQDVWKLVPLPEGKTAIGTKWILKNKRDTRGIVVRNKARLVAQGHRQEEGIDYDESAFLYEEIDEEVYVTQPKGFEDPSTLNMCTERGTIDKTLFIKKNSRDIIFVQVYVDDNIFGPTNKAWCTEFEVLMKGEFEMSVMGELTFFLGLQVKQQPDGIFISQDKYVQDMLRRFDMESVRPATTPYEAAKPKSKDEPDDAVNVHLYRSMIGSLMYLTASRPDIMFAVSACSRHQVTPLTSNLNAVKKIFKYLKGQPKLGLWYPRDSPFVLEAYSDSDYAGSNGDRKSTTGGCQFLGRRLISWQCKKQTVVATSSTEAEYVAAAHCCGQSTICIVKNPVFHQRTKHIEIRHHFIRDANEKNLIQDWILGETQKEYRLSSVSEQGKKIGSFEYELQAHKLLFKDVIGRLVKRVKILESKLKARGRNVILSESDNEEDKEQDVDSLIKLAKAAAIAADTSFVPADATQATEFPPSSSIHTDAFVHRNVIPTGTASDFFADPSHKGKSPMVKEDPPIKERSFRQMEEDRLGAEAARKLYEEEQAELAIEQEEMKKKRKEDVIYSAKYYTDADWSDIMGQVHANQGLTADLLGPDVNDDNFAERMVALIAERRRKFEAQRLQEKRNKPMTFAQQKDFMRTFVKNQSSAIYSTGWTLKYVKTFTDDQLKAEFDKIRNAAADLQAQNLRRSLKRPGADVEQPESKKSKSSAAPQTSVPAASHQSSAGVTTNVHQSPFVDTPPATPPHSPKASSHPDATPDTSVDPPVSRSSGPRTRSHSSAAGIKTYSTRRKSLATRKMSSSEVDLTAPDNSFIQVLSNDDSDDSDDDSDPLFFWHVFAAWEVVPTGLGDVNALYFTDKSSKYFTHLREILHLLDRQDLSKLYGMVVKHYEVNPLAGTGLILWGDLHVLFESTTGGSSVEVWNDQQEWVIRSWKLFPFSGVHVLETFTGKILYMFADTPYPLSASLMKKMLKHKLEVEIDGVGNDMTYAVQLIKFIKNQLASSVPSA